MKMKDPKQQIIDEIIVMDCQGGSTEAFQLLVSRWQKRLWQHAFRLTSDSQAAWDITQQSGHDIIKRLPKLHDPANFKAWAYRITTNKSIDWIKRKTSARQMQIESLDCLPAEAKSDTGIKELLDKLSAANKAVLSLYYFEQLSISEISLAPGIPQGTVKSRMHNARKELKELWQQNFE